MEDQNQNAKQEEAKEEKSTLMGGLKGVGIGLLIIGFAYYFYSTMTAYENGEEVTMLSILLIVYKILGKNITTGILGLIGGLVALGGVKEIQEAKAAEA